MSEEQQPAVRAEVRWWQQHRYVGLLAGAIAVSAVLVIVSLSLYNSSGAAQLDLSRPGYQSVRKNVVYDNDTSTYPASGQFDREAFELFIKLYDKRAEKVLVESAYDPAALSDESLQLFSAQQNADTPAE